MAYRDNISNKQYAPAPLTHTCCGGNPVPLPEYSIPGGIHSTSYTPGAYQGLPTGSSLSGTQVIPTALPTLPAAGATTTSLQTSPQVPSIPGAVAVQPTVPIADQVPSTLQNTFFTPGFLRTQIGRRVRVEFLLGTNLLTDRTGTLVAVGASYIVLRLVDSDDLMMCDIFSIKFVTIIL